MQITIDAEIRARMISSLRGYLEREFEDEVGDLKSRLLLDFFLEELAPTVYNRAIADAQAWMLERVEDLEGSCHVPEFGYRDPT